MQTGIMKSRFSYFSFKLSLIYGYSEVSDITGRHLSWVSFNCKIKTKQEIFRLQEHCTRWTEYVVRKPIITSRPKIRRNSKWLTANYSQQRKKNLHTLWFIFSFVDYSLLSIIYSFSLFGVGKKVAVSFFASKLSVFLRALSTQGI